MQVLTGGTDNHLLLIDVREFGINGRQAEAAVRECGVTLNRNSIPFDPNGAWFTSGLRVGTPAVSTLGMNADDMKEIASVLKLILSSVKPGIVGSGKNAGQSSKSKYELDPLAAKDAHGRITALLQRYPLYPELDLPLLQRHFSQ
jgi:glycine hydroxymethyltransferase